MLRGWPESKLLITVVRDENNEGHAVLTVRTDEGDFILDNRCRLSENCTTPRRDQSARSRSSSDENLEGQPALRNGIITPQSFNELEAEELPENIDEADGRVSPSWFVLCANRIQGPPESSGRPGGDDP